jgi:hypothetical protein
MINVHYFCSYGDRNYLNIYIKFSYPKALIRERDASLRWSIGIV